MQVTLTRTLLVAEEEISINALETTVQSWGHALMREMVALLWQQLTTEDRSCPACGAAPSSVPSGCTR